jgi:hypothetical protein
MGKTVPQHTYGGEGGEMIYSSYSFTTSALDRVSGQCPPPTALNPGGKEHATHWTEGWVGLRDGLDTVVTGKILLPLAGIEPRP